MWPMVPVVHMLYRLWQLGRGGALVAVLNGPVQLQYIQVLCCGSTLLSAPISAACMPA
jgi:hypothetical protein